MKRRSDPVVRFWSYVHIAGPDECWEWQRSRHPDGHGQFYVDPERTRMYAHRFAWEISRGKIPDDKCVCHRCDNPPCCNPRHLFLGTRGENTLDMWAKGRGVDPPHPEVVTCANGHPLEGDNVYRHGSKRRCRACNLAWQRANYARRRKRAA